MCRYARAVFIVGVLLVAASAPASAQLINGDDIILTDADPGIIFDDTDSPGNNWLIGGLNEQFFIHHVVTSNGYLKFDAVQSSIAMGRSASAPGSASVAIGYLAQANGTNGTALGWGANASGHFSSALGPFTTASGVYSSAIGASAFATGGTSTAVGHYTGAGGTNSTALGFGAAATGENSTALGSLALVLQANAMVLGSIPGVNDGLTYPNIGIGTNTPAEAVDVERSEAAARFQLTSFTAVASEAPQFIQRRARGTTAAPATVQNNDNLGLFSFRGHNGTNMGGSRATITAQAAGNFTGASTPTRLIFATTPVGQTVPQQVLVITPDGKVQVNGQNLNVPDYVFEDDYELMPLEELQSFIDTHGHLPGIPSADEINSGGHDLAGSDMLHLRKIEELTLYTLQQDAELRVLREEVAILRTLAERFAQLEQQMARYRGAAN